MDRWLALALVVATLQLCLFAGFDQRGPDDHDDFYTVETAPWVARVRAAPLAERPALLAQHFIGGELHPQLAQTALLATLSAAGPSYRHYRLVNLPFLLLAVLGTWALARELGTRHPGLAALAVATLPGLINASRKWDPQFHAACLTPVGLWLLAKALRDPRRWGLWLAAGLWQGARVYSHPIVLPDVLATVLGAFVFVGILHGRSAHTRAALGGLALYVAAFVAISGYYFGIFEGLLGVPDWSLPNYLFRRNSYWDEAAALSWTSASAGAFAVKQLAELSWLQLFPGMALIAAFGTVATVLLASSRRLLAPEDRDSSWLALGCVVLVLAELPVIALATSNRAFLHDWLFLAFPTVVASLWALERLLVGQRLLRGALLALFLGQAVFVVGAPLAARASGPDPVLEPAAYSAWPLYPFTRSGTGRHMVTHHLISTVPPPTDLVAAAMPGEGVAKLDVVDLTWDASRGSGPGCRSGSVLDEQAWSWGTPRGAGQLPRRLISAWPFVFAGFDDLEQRRPGPLAPLRKTTVVRLWVDGADAWIGELPVCRPEERLPRGFFQLARRAVAARYGIEAEEDLLRDPTGSLIGRVTEWEIDDQYLNAALLVLPPQAEIEAELGVVPEPAPVVLPDVVGEVPEGG